MIAKFLLCYDILGRLARHTTKPAPPIAMADTNMKYRLREIEFLGNRKHIIVLQDDAEWCPLVEISNIVLLRDEVPQGITICRTTNGEKYVRRVTLDHLLYTFMLRKIRLAVHKGLATEDQMNATLPVILANIRSLSTSFNVCPGGLKRCVLVFMSF